LSYGLRAELVRIVRESGKPHRVIAAAANCTEATLNRILRGRVRTCKLDTLEAIAAALGYEVKLVKRGD
jgi:DNA-binding Xre family transcriptional regulator